MRSVREIIADIDRTMATIEGIGHELRGERALTHPRCDCPCGCLTAVEQPWYKLPQDRQWTRCWLCWRAGDRPHQIITKANGAQFRRFLAPRTERMA